MHAILLKYIHFVNIECKILWFSQNNPRFLCKTEKQSVFKKNANSKIDLKIKALYTIFKIIVHISAKKVLSVSSQSTNAYQQIKDMIFQMELLPGARIPELQISAKLSISRTPIHDALRRLESEGLVTIGPNRGATVTCFSDDQIREIGTLRLSQDILSAHLASYYGSASDFDNLSHLADECEAAAASGDVYGRIRTDCSFHLAIAKISGNTQLINQQNALYQQIYLIQVSKYTDVEHSLLQIHHHKPMVAAIRSGDAEQMRTLICQHTKDFYHIDSYLLKCYCGGCDAEKS